MILDNIKELIKDMETILIKDERFKEDMYFKNMVKTIYNNNNNHQMGSYDITPIILSNLSKLGKSTEKIISTHKDHGKCECENYKLLIKELIEKVKNAKHESDKIGTSIINPILLVEIEKAEKAHDYKKALELARKLN